MSIRVLRVALVINGLVGLLALVRVVAWPLAPIELHASVDSSATVLARAAVRAPPAESVAAIVSRDPFRIGRQPAITAYDPVRLAQPIVPPPPRPQLILFGVVHGAEPSAVVEGFPGVEGARVVRVGDVVAGIRVQRIAPEHVRLAGMDTVWVLQVRKPWQ